MRDVAGRTSAPEHPRATHVISHDHSTVPAVTVDGTGSTTIAERDAMPQPSRDPGADRRLTTEQRGPVLVVRFGNEPGNFITDSIVGELCRVVAAAERDPSIRAVVLSSTVPGMFIGHYDSDELLAGSRRGGVPLNRHVVGPVLRLVAGLGRVPGAGPLLDRGPTGGLRALLRFKEAVQRMRRSDMVFVAAIGGYALGAGFELALACDLRIIGDGSYGIGLPEITFGLVPTGGGTQMLARLVGSGTTIEALLAGRLFTPEEAHLAGIVQRRVKQEDLLGEAVEVAARLSRRGPGTVAATKRAVYDAGSARLWRGMALERGEFMALATRKPAQATVRRYALFLRDSLRGGQAPTDFYRENLPDWEDNAPAGPADPSDA